MKTKRRKFGSRVRKNPFIIIGAMMFVIMFTSLRLQDQDAEGITLACRRSAECMAAYEAEQKASAAASAATATANYYQAKVASLTADIAAKQREILDTEAQIAELNTQIAESETKLKKEQEALAELLVNMHFDGDAEPITILAGSSSISDLAEKQARNDVAKQQISTVAIKVRETKEKLEADKAKVEQLLVSQQQAKKDLEAARVEQQQLVAKYQNDAAGYEAEVLAARNAQREAAARYRAEHASEFDYYDGENTYPWQGDCPGSWDDFTTYIDGYKVGGYVCECVSYVGWKAYEWYGIYLAYGNAYDWAWRAEADGYNVDHTPAVGSYGQSIYGRYGHVFWVEAVNSDGSIDVTEYNYGVDGRFSSRNIKSWAVSQYSYIHLEQAYPF